MDNILITGGAGYIGSHMSKCCAENNLNPVIVDNLSTGNKASLIWGDFREGDLKEFNFIDNVLQEFKPKAVIHFAAAAYVDESVKNPSKYYKNNVLTTLNLIEAMLKNNVKKLIFSSSCAIFGKPKQDFINEDCEKQPINPYGMTKLICENIIRDYSKAYDLKAICLRYFNAAGADPTGIIGELHDPETHVIPLIIEAALNKKIFTVYGDKYPTKDGTCIRDYIHVNDLVAAHLCALKKIDNYSFDVFNLGIGKGYSILELIRAVEKIKNCKIEYKFASNRPGDPPQLISDPKKANLNLGWEPKYKKIDEIIRSAINFIELNKDE